MKQNAITVIYDGKCEFCMAWLEWLQRELEISAISFHDAELEKYQLTYQQCSREVFVVTQSNRYAGADAISFLLAQRGNVISASMLRILGPLSRFGYQWIANHRNSVIIRIWTKLLQIRLSRI